MNARTEILKRELNPYIGVFFFISLLIFTHFFWKFAVDADLRGRDIAIFGRNMTNQFHFLSAYVAELVYGLVRLLPDTETFFRQDTHLYFADGKNLISIIWGCTGVKQIFIFIIIIACYKGSLRHKLWYIPVGSIILEAFNIVRIASICVLTRNNPERFDSLHDGWFRYAFYALIFILWLVWEEKFTKKNENKEEKEEEYTEVYVIKR